MKLGKMKSYRGAGILFCSEHGNQVSVLLAQRRGSGVWSVPGGGRHETDADSWSTARRETSEEFGSPPDSYHVRFPLAYPFGMLGFQWTTFVVEVPEIPPIDIYPDCCASDFMKEFRDASWFPVRALPPKTHWLLYPAIWRIRMMGL